MSCFEVSKNTIDQICSLSFNYFTEAKDWGGMHHHFSNRWEDAEALGNGLQAMNHQAWKTRYPSQDNAPPAAYSYPMKKYSIFQCLNACDCWLYQCSESEALMNSNLFKSIEKLADVARRHIITNHEEYKKCTWGS